MLVPMHCPECSLSFCVKHRLEIDHQCQGKPAAPSRFKKSAAAVASNQPSRAELDRQRRERANAANQRKQEIARLQNKAKQGKITDNEQIQLAKLLSLKEKDGKCTIS
jgi:AN1-type zinc finger protein 2